MTEEEKKLSPKERYDLINQKIDEIKKLADDCVLLVHVDNASMEANTLLAAGRKAGKQAIMIDRFINESPEIKKIKSDIDFNKLIWTEICNQMEKETKIGLWLALAMSFFLCLSIVIDWYCK